MKKSILLSLILLTLAIIGICVTAQQDNQPPQITIISPQENTSIQTSTPAITIKYFDSYGINLNSIEIIVDGIDVTEWEETIIESTQLSYIPSEIFQLKDGNHTVEITVSDMNNNPATVSWTFIVNTTQKQLAEEGIDIYVIISYTIIGSTIGIVLFGLYIFYLKKSKKFTFKKYFIQHPIHKKYLVLYLPFIIAFLFTTYTLAYVTTTPDLAKFSPEYVIIIGIFIALSPYSINVQFEKRRSGKYERAFSQFLFELADAMRGGLDPTKAVIELAKSDKSILKEYLKIAADNIQLGRPFDEVMAAMARPINSSLVKRYARLIGETSKLGGETSQVIYRTAKDMDDFIKINQDRRRQLMTQTTTIYIAFAVLLIVLYQLLTMFPTLGSIDISLLGAKSMEAVENTNREIIRMSPILLKRRFFHLVIINSIGTGTIIGQFIEGNPKYGLIHSLILTSSAVLFFSLLIL